MNPYESEEQRAEKTAQLLAKAKKPGPRPAPPPGKKVDKLMATMETMGLWRQRYVEFEAKFHAWMVETEQGETLTCPQHGYERALEVERSVRESFRDGEMIAYYMPCPHCNSARLDALKLGWVSKAGVPADKLHATIDNFREDPDDPQSKAEAAKEFVRKGRGFLFMLGKDGAEEKYGNGKSHLAVAVMKMVGHGLFITHWDLVERRHRGYRDELAPDILEKCKKARLLVIDEVGRSPGGKDDLPMVQQIIWYRHEERLPTVITANMTIEEICELVGPHVKNRIMQSKFGVLIFRGGSRRGEVEY